MEVVAARTAASPSASPPEGAAQGSAAARVLFAALAAERDSEAAKSAARARPQSVEEWWRRQSATGEAGYASLLIVRRSPRLIEDGRKYRRRVVRVSRCSVATVGAIMLHRGHGAGPRQRCFALLIRAKNAACAKRGKEISNGKPERGFGHTICSFNSSLILTHRAPAAASKGISSCACQLRSRCFR